MFSIDINEDNSSIRITQNDSTIIADGKFVVDQPDHMVLVRIIHTTVSSDDTQQLHDLLTFLDDVFGKTYSARVVVRFSPLFDKKIDRNQSELKNTVPRFMVVNLSDLKYNNDDLNQYAHERYTLVTDKQAITVYAKQIMIMMTTEALWAKHWDEQETHNRIFSASAVAMIFDKVDKVPVGFGRMLIVRNKNTNEEQTFGYLSDVAVSLQHQGKGLGRVIVNYLIGQNVSQQPTNGSLCLICIDQGSGAIHAPNLYRSFGFEHLDKMGNQNAIFLSEKYHVRRSVQLQCFHQN